MLFRSSSSVRCRNVPRARSAAAADAAVTAAEKILRDTAKGKVADDLIAQGIADVKAKIGIELSSDVLEARKPLDGRPSHDR